MKTYEGKLTGQEQRIGIIVARFNALIGKSLLEGALDALNRLGVEEEDIEILWVPGAYEIPFMAQMMAQSGKYDGVLCLGAVIRGATPHFEYVSSEVAKGIAQVSLSQQVPIIFGVLTTDTLEQAIERAGTKGGNKGYDTAVSVIEMINLVKDFKSRT